MLSEGLRWSKVVSEPIAAIGLGAAMAKIGDQCLFNLRDRNPRPVYCACGGVKVEVAVFRKGMCCME